MRLDADTVVAAARRLFGTASESVLIPFALKYGGASSTSFAEFTSNDIPGVKYLSDVGDGFEKFVKDHFDELPRRAEDGGPGLPIRGQGGSEGYKYYRPLVPISRFLLQKDIDRSVVWTQLSGGELDPHNGIDPMRELFVFEKLERGGRARFLAGYEEKVALYCAVKENGRLSIPWEAFVLWCARNVDFAQTPSWADIEETVVRALHFTEKERVLWFKHNEQARQFRVVASRPAEDYFKKLLFESREIRIHEEMLVTGQTAEEKVEHLRRQAAVAGVDDGPETGQLAHSLVAQKHLSLIFLGPPRTSKSHEARALAQRYLGKKSEAELYADQKHFLHLQLHKDITYQDLILRQQVQLDAAGLKLTFMPGVLLQFLQTPEVQKEKAVVLLEEANRANLSAVLGELFQVIEMPYRGHKVILAGSDPKAPMELTIPKELLLICTMNNVDRSTYAVDMALLGRFRVVPCRSSLRTARAIMRDAGAGDDLQTKIANALDQINKLSGYEIGHAYLHGVKTAEDFRMLYETAIRPALEHYLGPAASSVLPECDVTARTVI